MRTPDAGEWVCFRCIKTHTKEKIMTWFAEPYIAENVAWELEATTKEDAIREAEELRSEIHIKYYIYEEKES